MVLTRHYARIPFGTDSEMELCRARDARFITITLHAAEAAGLLAQVAYACYVYDRMSVTFLLCS